MEASCRRPTNASRRRAGPVDPQRHRRMGRCWRPGSAARAPARAACSRSTSQRGWAVRPGMCVDAAEQGAPLAHEAPQQRVRQPRRRGFAEEAGGIHGGIHGRLRDVARVLDLVSRTHEERVHGAGNPARAAQQRVDRRREPQIPAHAAEGDRAHGGALAAMLDRRQGRVRRLAPGDHRFQGTGRPCERRRTRRPGGPTQDGVREGGGCGRSPGRTPAYAPVAALR